MATIIGVKFRTAQKIYYFDPDGIQFAEHDGVIVETIHGLEYGDVVLDKQAEEVKPVVKGENEIDYKDLYHREIENRKLVEEDLHKATKVIEEFREKLKEVNKLLKD